MSKDKKEFLKIWFQDIQIAEEFFDGNQKHLGEFLVNVYRSYAELPTSFSCKLVEKYFKTYSKQITFIKDCKVGGIKGAEEKAKRQEVKLDTLEGVLEGEVKGELEGDLEANVKSKKLNVKGKRLKENYNEEDLPKGSFQEFLKIYSDWYELRVGVKIIFDGAQGKSLKKIITYLIDNSHQKNAQGGADAWGYILSNWDKLEPFYRDQLKVNQILSNLPNILNQLKNGNSKTKPTNNQSSIHAAIDALV